MTLYESKIRGMIVVCLAVTITPLVFFIVHHLNQYKIPVFADQGAQRADVEIFEDHRKTGVYFVPPEISVNQLLETAGLGKSSQEDLPVKSGMKIMIDSASGNREIEFNRMPVFDRLSLGLPIDINTATEEDLIMIKGIGRATARKILDLRNKVNRFTNIRQLMHVKGIKEKKLAQIQKYLYVKK